MEQGSVARQVVNRELTVRQTEALVRKVLAGPTAATQAKVDPDVRRLQDELSQKLGSAVQIQHTARGKGKLVINYSSLDELDGILSHMN
jgi:ParB family chromosome partitioning protein